MKELKKISWCLVQTSSTTISIHVYLFIHLFTYIYVAVNLNEIVNNYWNSVALDGNSWTWSNTRNRTQTPKFKIPFLIQIYWHWCLQLLHTLRSKFTLFLFILYRHVSFFPSTSGSICLCCTRNTIKGSLKHFSQSDVDITSSIRRLLGDSILGVIWVRKHLGYRLRDRWTAVRLSTGHFSLRHSVQILSASVI
jgi:hypothetical protein